MANPVLKRKRTILENEVTDFFRLFLKDRMKQ
jgi:hypothetical protein